MPSLASRFRYRLGCHCCVALYMFTDSLNVWVTARIKSVAPRINRGISACTPGVTGIDASHKEKPTTWTIVTGERWWMEILCNLDGHTWEICTSIVEPCKNKANDDLWHINKQQEIKNHLGPIPHCIDAQNHDYCNWHYSRRQWKETKTVTHNRQYSEIFGVPRQLSMRLQCLLEVHASTTIVGRINSVHLHL